MSLVFFCTRFFTQPGLDLVTGTAHRTEVACLVMINSLGRGAVTRHETRGPSSTSSHSSVASSSPSGQWWYGFLPRLARSRAVPFSATAAAAPTPAARRRYSVLFGVVGCFMQCDAMPALCALSHTCIDKGIWHLSHSLKHCRDYGMREKHMGISARLNLLGFNGMQSV